MMKMLKNPHEIEIEHLWWNVDLTPLHGLLSTPLPCCSILIQEMDYPLAMNVVTKIAMFTKQIITLNGAVCCLHFFGFVCSSCHCDCEPGGGGGGGGGGMLTFFATARFSCTSTHTSCYATASFSCTFTHTSCYATARFLLHFHTYVMRRYC